MKPRLVVVLADLHCGSTYGIMPPGFHTKEGNEIGLNEVQKWLWECWNDCWAWFYKLAGRAPWSLVLNGDLVDGYHHGTKEVWSNDESDHGIGAYHLLKSPGRKAYSVYLTEGTEVHTKGLEHSLAYQLKSGGVPIVRPKGEGGAWPSLDIEFAKTYCKFDHHISTSKRKYLTGTKMTAEYGDLLMRSAMAGHKAPKVVGRAHCHEFDSHDNGYGLIFTSPPWQVLTRFGRRVVPNAIGKVQVGMVVLDWRHTEDNCTPVLHKRLHIPKQSTLLKS